MKGSLRPVQTAGGRLVISICCLLAFAPRANGAQANGAQAEARITRVIGKVALQPGGMARLNAGMPEGTTIRTGEKARAELTLPGKAVLRLGANTAVQGGRGGSVRLEEGALLFQAGRNASGTEVGTGLLTAEARGATGIIDRHRTAYVKVLVLEGTARVYLPKAGESVLVRAGQLLITKPEAKILPEPVHFDIEQLYKTSLLTNSDFAPLASNAEIARAIQKQRNDPDFIRTNLVIFGRGTLVNLVEPIPAPPPKPPPPKP